MGCARSADRTRGGVYHEKSVLLLALLFDGVWNLANGGFEELVQRRGDRDFVVVAVGVYHGYFGMDSACEEFAKSFVGRRARYDTF